MLYTTVRTFDTTCREAVEAYAADLATAGLDVRVCEIGEAIAFEDGAGTELRVEWSVRRETIEREEWEEDVPDEGAMGFLAHAAGQYGRTIERLARDTEASASFLRR
jgi:hypothetical protein